ncbi:hypothetical protein ACFYVR_21295 [Rhodococcus sp. NPDC003318]|uniref:hypothetical protein n=1 Tax=Rhodococcus sp. NPDC003318 TaxID=3364503 RepID=UPI0036AC1A57
MSGRGDGFSYGRLALASLGAATAVLALAAVLVAVLRPSGVWGLLIALAGVAGAIAAMGVVSTRMTRRAFGGRDAAGGPDPEAGADR